MSLYQAKKPDGTQYKNWRCCFIGPNGRRCHRSTRTPDYRLAERRYTAWSEEARQIREGLISGKSDALRQQENRPIQDHLEEYIQGLQAKGRNPVYLASIRRSVERFIEVAYLRRSDDIGVWGMERLMIYLRTKGHNARTLNVYLGDCKAFAAWLERSERVRSNPLRYLKRQQVDADRRLVRRELTLEELTAMVRAANSDPRKRGGLTGEQRALLYLLALGTGLRLGEIRSLTAASFDLATGKVTLQAAYSKRRRKDTLPMHASLVTALRPWITAMQPDDRLFPRLPTRAADMVRHDLDAARQAWIAQGATLDERKRRADSAFLRHFGAAGSVDFHAIRHTYISRLTRGGASIKVLKDMARHSDAKYTLDIYAHTNNTEMTAAAPEVPHAA